MSQVAYSHPFTAETPDCLALQLAYPTVEELRAIADSVDGGAANIQDIYPLTPAQEGLLFHLLASGKPARKNLYVMRVVLTFPSRRVVTSFINALQSVVARHDALRTAVLWQGLSRPFQVVHRTAELRIQEISIERASGTLDWITRLQNSHASELDLSRPPLMQLHLIAGQDNLRHYVMLEIHHIISDAQSLWRMFSEVIVCLEGRAQQLPEPVPFRNYVARTLGEKSALKAREFFRTKLQDVDRPTAPFGFMDLYNDGANISEAREKLDPRITMRARLLASSMSVFPAAIIHAACALVVAHTSKSSDIVFGTILLGRLHRSADPQRAQGMFVNTLPIRLRLQNISCKDLINQTQRELMGLLTHEHASLAATQRLSRIGGSAPLFTVLVNYRYGFDWETELARIGAVPHFMPQRTNYPIALTVDDEKTGFRLTAETDQRIDARLMVRHLHMALKWLMDAVEHAPLSPALSLTKLL